MNGITVLVGFNSQSSRRPSTPLSQYVKCEDIYQNRIAILVSLIHILVKILIESNIIGVKVIPINVPSESQIGLTASQSSHGN